MCIHCRGKLFTEPLPSDNTGIVDVFTGRYLQPGVCLSTYSMTTAVLVLFEISAQQRVYTPQHLEITHDSVIFWPTSITTFISP
jgi:hypothetical protein